MRGIQDCMFMMDQEVYECMYVHGYAWVLEVDFDVVIWSLCNVINGLCYMVCLCIYVWNLVIKRWSLNQDLCYEVHVNGW